MSEVEGCTPILRIENPERSRRYYVDVLGFKVDWETPSMMSVSRGPASLMLCMQHQGNPGTWVWIGVEDADVLHAEFVAKGASIRQAPTNFQWSYEFQVEDPDGHVLRFGSEPKDAPFGHFKV